MSSRKHTDAFSFTTVLPSKRPKCGEAGRSRTGYDQTLWVEKYSPNDVTHMVGNAAKIKALKDWLLNWQSSVLGKRVRVTKAILLSGPPGVGKTTSARLVSTQLGYKCFEVNASDSRNKSSSSISEGVNGNLNSMVRELITNSTIGFADEIKPSVLIMDEVDGMSSGDRGGVAELISLIKITKIPIICICNDRYSTKLKSLLPHCEDCTFHRPMRPQLVKYVSEIARKEHMQITDETLTSLVETCEGDLRLLLNQLQLLELNSSTNQLFQRPVKDVPGNPFANADRIFAGAAKAGNTVQIREQCALSDADLISLFVHENYLNMRPRMANTDYSRLKLLSTAACRISDADVTGKAVYSEQKWALLPVSTISGSILPASIVSGKREVLSSSPSERNFNRFPSVLGKLSSKNKAHRLCHELSSHFLSNAPCAPITRQIRLDYFPLVRTKTLREMTFLTKGGRELAGIDDIVSFMNKYGLTREDWDTLHDLTRFSGKGPIFQSTAGVLCSKVKAAFTRACKKQSRP